MMGRKKTSCSRLRHRLTLQQEVQTADGAGGYAKSWQDVADLWAEIVPISGAASNLVRSSGKEIVVGGQVQSEISHHITLRYRAGVTPAMRLLFETRAFNILYVANVEEKNEVLELLVQEGVAT